MGIELLAIVGVTDDVNTRSIGLMERGVEMAVKELRDVSVNVQFASEYTPEKVRLLMEKWKLKRDRSGQPGVIIVGGEKGHSLTTICQIYVNPSDLVIGVPMYDSGTVVLNACGTDGLSSWLSTGERPPLNPVLMTPFAGSTAVHIAYRWLAKPVTNRKISLVVADEYSMTHETALEKALMEAEMNYRKTLHTEAAEGVLKNSVMVTACHDDDAMNLERLAQRKESKAIIVRVQEIGRGTSGHTRGYPEPFHVYSSTGCDKIVHYTGFVGVDANTNAAMLAAILSHNHDAVARFVGKRKEIEDDIAADKGILVRNVKQIPLPEFAGRLGV